MKSLLEHESLKYCQLNAFIIGTCKTDTGRWGIKLSWNSERKIEEVVGWVGLGRVG